MEEKKSDNLAVLVHIPAESVKSVCMNLVLTTVLKNLILHLNSLLCIRIVYLFKETEKETPPRPTRLALLQLLHLSTSAPGDTMLRGAIVTCCLPGTVLGNGVGVRYTLCQWELYR